MPSEGQKVDPRFDPRFQRGYEGALGDGVAPAKTRGEEPPQVAPPAVDPEPARSPTRAPVGSDDERYLPVIVTDHVGELPETRRLLNPFIILLWIVGPALAVGGVLGGQEVFAQQWSSNFSPEEAGRWQGLMMATQAAVTVGIATTCGLLFWHAAAWRSVRP